jgi:hypothetical protein
MGCSNSTRPKPEPREDDVGRSLTYNDEKKLSIDEYLIELT